MKYFLHDTNAFQDEKISELFIEFGYEGLGLFYTILEKIAQQEKPVKTTVLKHQLGVGKKLEKCWLFMESLGIISSNNGETFNERILSYSETYKIKKEKNKKRISEFRKNQDVAENVTRYSAESIPHKVNKSKVNRIEVNKEINKESFIVSENKNFVDPEPENKPEPPPKKKPPEPKKIKKLFRESEFYDIDRLSLALMGTAYQEANVRYYHESALNWSESNGEKKMDWLATLKNWMARDMTAGKFITNDFKISQKNGNSKQQNGKQPTGSEVSTSSIARTITELYYGAGNDGKR